MAFEKIIARTSAAGNDGPWSYPFFLVALIHHLRKAVNRQQCMILNHAVLSISLRDPQRLLVIHRDSVFKNDVRAHSHRKGA